MARLRVIFSEIGTAIGVTAAPQPVKKGTLMDLTKLEVGMSLPGEQLVCKVLDMAVRMRESMDPEVRKKWDDAAYAAYRDWNHFAVDVLKWPGTKLP